MGTLSGKSRRVLRAIYRGLGVTMVSLGGLACNPLILPGSAAYGMPPGYPYDREELRIHENGLIIELEEIDAE